MPNFFDVCKKMAKENRFKTLLLLFLNQIIRYKLTLININQVLSKAGLSIFAIANTSIFIVESKNNVNLIAS